MVDYTGVVRLVIGRTDVCSEECERHARVNIRLLIHDTEFSSMIKRSKAEKDETRQQNDGERPLMSAHIICQGARLQKANFSVERPVGCTPIVLVTLIANDKEIVM